MCCVPLFTVIILYVCIFCLHEYMCTICPGNGMGSHKTQWLVVVGCELPCGDWTWLLCRSNKHSKPQSHVSHVTFQTFNPLKTNSFRCSSIFCANFWLLIISCGLSIFIHFGRESHMRKNYFQIVGHFFFKECHTCDISDCNSEFLTVDLV